MEHDMAFTLRDGKQVYVDIKSSNNSGPWQHKRNDRDMERAWSLFLDYVIVGPEDQRRKACRVFILAFPDLMTGASGRKRRQ
jgi:hypothetical protein